MANKVEVNFDDTENIDLSKRNDDNDDDDVKDNWDDESEDEETKKSALAPAAQEESAKSSKKKSLKDKLAEKEQEKKRQEEAARSKLEAMSRTPEDIAAERARIKKEQEDSDFALAMDTFADSGDVPSSGMIDSFEPSSAEGFEQFRKLLSDKIEKYQQSQFYPLFLQGLFQDLSLNLNSEDVRKCGSLLTTLAQEKAKKEKEVSLKGKARAKGKLGKGTLATGKKDDAMENYGDDYDAIDDMF